MFYLFLFRNDTQIIRLVYMSLMLFLSNFTSEKDFSIISPK